VVGHDVHRRLAAQLFKIPESEVTEEQRQYAKKRSLLALYGAPAEKDDVDEEDSDALP
jgi:DNA polymerase I-like protein with 3'-5' exonuclease and polymerase domains